MVLVFFSFSEGRSETSATVTIHGEEPGAMVNSNLFGVFFEEINYAGEGGLYGEMVRNRSFYNSEKANFWELVTTGNATGAMSVDAANPLNASIHHSLRLSLTSGIGSVGAGNSGFWGMAVKKGETYNLGFFAKGDPGNTSPIDARLESADGNRVYAQVSLAGLTMEWQHFTTQLLSSGTDTNARLVVAISKPGTVWLDVVSLFPQATFHGRPNGLRQDLAEKIAALHPSFLRFPGGNFIEGYSISNALRWKTTIGNVAQRPGHFDDSWGYWSTDGLGAYEFFQFCEDAGMESLYGINAGLMLNYTGSADNTVPLDQLKPWIQDALDLIEYANGDTNTTWGARRTADGHPAPFNLKYMEIGNENGGPLFDERYSMFYDAIKSKYPSMHLIAPGNWAGGHPWSRPVEIADEHYYDSPATFISYATKYDSYDRRGPKIFVGEYAVTSGFGAYGNLAAALGEAAFMTGLERNADVVQMASYAPMLANVNGIQWRPDMIYYDNSRSFGTPSYYVQQMFSNNRGDVVLPTSVKETPDPSTLTAHGAIGLGSWNTAVEYSNVEVKSNGVTLYRDEFASVSPQPWRVFDGSWSMADGSYKQKDTSSVDCRATTGSTNWANYSISLRARKTGGKEGFLILFNWLDDNNWTWLNVGGWGNKLTAIEQDIGGTKSMIGSPVPQYIADNTWYDIRVVLSGPRIRCYVNGSLVQDVIYPSGVFVSSTYARTANEVIIKAVNPYRVPATTRFKINGFDSVSSDASVIRLTSGRTDDENSLEYPTKVFPVTDVITSAGNDFTVVLPGNSLSILRLKATDEKSYTSLGMQLPTRINSGQTIPCLLRALRAGSSKWSGLTENLNHAITYASDNPSIATVDPSGNITGVAAGTATITASYDSLGLSARQKIRVANTPAQLVHRYSFDETSGTKCADSVGGPAWKGTLPAGGTFDGGRLTLSAADSQYVQLPSGILSNYTAVTIDMWATFSSQLPEHSFLFGFGGISDGSGDSYIFCAPRAGRVAITDSDFMREENATGNFDCSFNSNLHLTAVFNPPLGCISLYTNGVLAGISRYATTPLSSVRDVYNYIGRSLYSVDPYPDVILDEFRIYSGALTPEEISENQRLGPNKLAGEAHSYSQR